MIYCKAIRKIFDVQNGMLATDLDDAIKLAEQAGYKMLTFNGDIYVKELNSDKNKWHLSDLNLEDLEAC